MVAILFALALLQPWSFVPVGSGEVAPPDTGVRDGVARLGSGSTELEEARRCSGLVRPAVRGARALCVRISERRGGVETRLGKIDASPTAEALRPIP